MPNKIVVCTSPVERFQKIYVFQDGALIDQVGVIFEDLNDTLFAFVDKYNISDVDFTGVESYAQGIIKNFKEKNLINYSKTININYVQI